MLIQGNMVLRRAASEEGVVSRKGTSLAIRVWGRVVFYGAVIVIAGYAMCAGSVRGAEAGGGVVLEPSGRYLWTKVWGLGERERPGACREWNSARRRESCWLTTGDAARASAVQLVRRLGGRVGKWGAAGCQAGGG